MTYDEFKATLANHNLTVARFCRCTGLSERAARRWAQQPTIPLWAESWTILAAESSPYLIDHLEIKGRAVTATVSKRRVRHPPIPAASPTD